MTKKLMLALLCGVAPVMFNGCSCQTDKKETKEVTTKTATTKEMKNTMNEIKTTPSGLRYQIQQAAPADAKKPTKGNKVTVHYTGWLEDKDGQPNLDKKFDSSVGRAPFSFVIGAGMVIQGWDEGVMDMAVGEKRRLIIPGNLAYGKQGYPGVIPPNATLIFDVELLEAA
ncbi:MAG: FKBP-type peptidyl-prolyl cis-trans isomerase [Candidatus Dependentiae bacterium]|nr:FKBP-type peptidyl-prolyl cis-trans isomerase [Candidatus Dependentiae bacterium]